MNLATLEILEIVDPMCRLAIFARMMALSWQERYRTGEDALAWDYIGLARWQGWTN